MKKTRFLLASEPQDGMVKVKNLLYASVIELDEEAANWLMNGEIDRFNQEEKELLFEHKFLISDETDENEVFTSHYHKAWEELDVLLLHLVPTTGCQLKCVYCYEDGIVAKTVNKDTTTAISDWISLYLQNNKVSTLRIVWHGGEPLLCSKQIEQMMPVIKAIADEAGVTLETQIVTNGLFLFDEVASVLAKFNLQRVQVTLDGPPDIHERRRAPKDGSAGTFNQILANITNILDKKYIEKVDLRINIDRENIDRTEELLDILVGTGIQNQLYLSIGIVTNTLPGEDCSTGSTGHFQEFGFSEEQAIQGYIRVARAAKARGLRIPEEFVIGPWCVARHPHAWTIGPDGEIYKCLSTVGREDGIVGMLPEVPKDCGTEAHTMNRIQSCFVKECPVLPLCGGGCIFDEKVNGQTCPWQLLETINRELLALNNK